MRIDPYGMRHLPLKPDEMEMRASVDMNLRKERSSEERRALQERMRRAQEEERPLSEEEAKARAAAQRQQVLRSPEEQRRFDLALERDNLLRQAMTAAAHAYPGMRERMLAKATGVLRSSAGLVGLQSGDGPLFELRGPAADPAWRLGRGRVPEAWYVCTLGECVRLADQRTGVIQSEWDGSRWLAGQLRSQLEAALRDLEPPALERFRIGWMVRAPGLEESSLDLYEVSLARLGSQARLDAVKRYSEVLRERSQAALREQPPLSAQTSRGPVVLLGLADGKLVPAERPTRAGAVAEASGAPSPERARETMVELLEQAGHQTALARVARTEAVQSAHALAAAEAYDRAAELLLEVSAAELDAVGRGVPIARNTTLDLLKLARDHVQAFGAKAASTLVSASRQAIENQRRGRARA
jgi:hypothetical protein